MKIKVTKKGKVRFRVLAKKGEFVLREPGVMQVTVGFQDLTGNAEANSCSAMIQAFRAVKKGLRYP